MDLQAEESDRWEGWNHLSKTERVYSERSDQLWGNCLLVAMFNSIKILLYIADLSWL